MTVDDLYQMLDNVTLLTRFFVVSNTQDVLVWGDKFQDIPHQIRSMKIVHCKYQDGEVMIWLE